jgi:hypothetical protein
LLAKACERKNRVRVNGNFSNQFKLIWVVQSCQQKYFAFPPRQIEATFAPSRSSQEGRIAIVMKRGAGCGGREGYD